jgi:hypothetical protein
VARLRKAIRVPCFFRHVPRDRNKVADWLTNVARTAEASVDCTRDCRASTPFAAPPEAHTPTTTAQPGALVAPVTTRATTKRRRLEAHPPEPSPAAGGGGRGTGGGAQGGGEGEGGAWSG